MSRGSVHMVTRQRTAPAGAKACTCGVDVVDWSAHIRDAIRLEQAEAVAR